MFGKPFSIVVLEEKELEHAFPIKLGFTFFHIACECLQWRFVEKAISVVQLDGPGKFGHLAFVSSHCHMPRSFQVVLINSCESHVRVEMSFGFDFEEGDLFVFRKTFEGAYWTEVDIV